MTKQESRKQIFFPIGNFIKPRKNDAEFRTKIYKETTEKHGKIEDSCSSNIFEKFYKKYMQRFIEKKSCIMWKICKSSVTAILRKAGFGFLEHF